MQHSMAAVRCAVIGNPIAHSRSPQIHAAFAAQIGLQLDYSRILAAQHEFEATVRSFFASSTDTQPGRGLNVTVPFKLRAFELATVHTERALAAQAANTLWMHQGQLHADNTDGAGLVQDLQVNLLTALKGSSVLILGAGGATQGVLLPMLQAGVNRLCIANRTLSKATALVAQFNDAARTHCALLEAVALDLTSLQQQAPFDIVINATAAGLNQQMIELPAGLFSPGGLGYDMSYGPTAARLLEHYAAQGASCLADGLGMLVEQAALSFAQWHGVQPDTAPVLVQLRANLVQ